MRIFYILASCLAAFTYGLYVSMVLTGKHVAIERWIITGAFGVTFFIAAVKGKN